MCKLKVTIFWIICVCFLISCKNSISPINDERLYKIQTIHDLTVEEFNDRYNVHEWPLAFKIKIIMADKTYQGSVNLAKLGWLQINNWEKYTGNDSSFYVDTKGKLGPVEYIDFYQLEITNIQISGIFSCSGPTIDTGGFSFVAKTDD